MIIEVYEHHRVDKGRTIAKIRFKRWSWWPFWTLTEALSRRYRSEDGRWRTEWYCPKRGVPLIESDQITRLVEGRETYEAFTKDVDDVIEPWPDHVPYGRARRE